MLTALAQNYTHFDVAHFGIKAMVFTIEWHIDKWKQLVY